MQYQYDWEGGGVMEALCIKVGLVANNFKSFVFQKSLGNFRSETLY